MYSFMNDYSEGAHPRILKALTEINGEQFDGYGADRITKEAAGLIRNLINNYGADVHFISGGTLTNLTAISAFLRPHEAVISASTGHISLHETGAIESTGHKIILLESNNGKITAEQVQKAFEAHTDEHMVKPKLVYISNSTEIGTIYRKSELEQLSRVCREYGMLLYIDGARLGTALCSDENDISMSDLGRLADSFYIGGTKNGALLGEALVICNDMLKEDFRFHIKQKGGLMAKGWVIGLQFAELLKDGLYFELAGHSNRLAGKLMEGIASLGYEFLSESSTNQIFPILPNNVIKKLQEKYMFHIWSKYSDDTSVIRLVTSWAAQEEMIDAFLNDLK
jgi:threonine aldolase